MTAQADILLIDDDVLIRYMVEDIVDQMGHRFSCAACGETARAMLSLRQFDLVILDRWLPDTDGLLLVPDIQRNAKTPFIILSTLSSPNDQALGLGMGAVDYVCKPVEQLALRARIEKHLAAGRGDGANTVLEIASVLKLNTLTRRLWLGGRTEILSPAKTRLLALMIQNLEHPLNRMQISQAIFNREWIYGDRTVDVLISRLRQRLRGCTVQIITVHGLGYMLVNNKGNAPGQTA